MCLQIFLEGVEAVCSDGEGGCSKEGVRRSETPWFHLCCLLHLQQDYYCFVMSTLSEVSRAVLELPSKAGPSHAGLYTCRLELCVQSFCGLVANEDS